MTLRNVGTGKHGPLADLRERTLEGENYLDREETVEIIIVGAEFCFKECKKQVNGGVHRLHARSVLMALN